ncbi:MAG: hypothetical protein HXY40_07465 [Chloroflexi bacterium]|nr:hypothetical protein [Chloroflexota bacterium]
MILHPNYLNQHVLIEQLLQLAPVVYVRFTGSRLAHAQAETQLQAALVEQTGQNRLDTVHTLVLDECDRVLSSEFDVFLPQLAVSVGAARVFVITRRVPQCVISSETLRGQTRFLPTETGLLLWDYAQRPTTQVLLEVRAFGSGGVLLNGQPITNWDGVLPRALFFYLVDQGMATRNQIFETFWSKLNTHEATNVFHVTKRKVSEVLGTDLTTFQAGFYRISPNIELSYDAATFNEMAQRSAVLSPEEALLPLRQAVALYKGPFLTSITMDWVKARRQELLQTYGEALVSLAKLYEQGGKPHEALGLYLRAIMTNRQREDLAAAVMRLYRELQLRADALLVYERLRETLVNALNMQPAAFVQELAAEIRREVDAGYA